MNRKLFLPLIMLMTSVVMFAAGKTTEVFTVDHQMTTACEKKIMNNLRYEKGITDLKVSLKENTITISYKEDKTDTEKILAAFKKIGLSAMLASEANCAEPAKTCCKEKAE